MHHYLDFLKNSNKKFTYFANIPSILYNRMSRSKKPKMRNWPSSHSEKEKGLNQILKEMLSEIRKYHEKLSQEHWLPYVISEELENIDFEKVKIVLVWDNPWKDEYRLGQYFSEEGSSWKMARKLFDGIFWEGSFSRDVLVLNKTLFHTNRTHDLHNESFAPFLDESQKHMAEFLLELLKKKDMPVIVVWFDEMHGLFLEYFAILWVWAYKLGKLNTISVTPHFSMSKIFCKHSNRHWNSLIDTFISKHPELDTGKWNISSKAFFESEDPELYKEFVREVLVKQNITDYPG